MFSYIAGRIIIHADHAHFLRYLKSVFTVFMLRQTVSNQSPHDFSLGHARRFTQRAQPRFKLTIQPDYQRHDYF